MIAVKLVCRRRANWIQVNVPKTLRELARGNRHNSVVIRGLPQCARVRISPIVLFRKPLLNDLHETPDVVHPATLGFKPFLDSSLVSSSPPFR